MHIGNSDVKEYTINGTVIDTVHEEKDLGVIIDDKLKFRNHVQNAAKTANIVLGSIRRTFKYIDRNVFLNLYKSLVRPHLEYASPAWSITTKRDSAELERVQRRATKIVQKLKHLKYPDRLRALGLPTLEYRRQRADVIETYRIITGIDQCEKDTLFEQQQGAVTRGNSKKFLKNTVNWTLENSVSHNESSISGTLCQMTLWKQTH